MIDVIDDLFVFEETKEGALGQYPATVYKRPNGRREEITVRNIYHDDAQWFGLNGVVLGLEDCGSFYAIYLEHDDYFAEDGESPGTYTYVVKRNESCQDALHKARMEFQILLGAVEQ